MTPTPNPDAVEAELRNQLAAAVACNTAWQHVFDGFEAHLLDRINMRDPAKPDVYLSIIRHSAREVNHRSKQIQASTQNYQASLQRHAEHLDAELRLTSEEIARLREALGRAAHYLSDDVNDPESALRVLGACLLDRAALSHTEGETK